MELKGEIFKKVRSRDFDMIEFTGSENMKHAFSEDGGDQGAPVGAL